MVDSRSVASGGADKCTGGDPVVTGTISTIATAIVGAKIAWSGAGSDIFLRGRGMGKRSPGESPNARRIGNPGVNNAGRVPIVGRLVGLDQDRAAAGREAVGLARRRASQCDVNAGATIV